jgi:hypothetical protein
MDRKVRGLLVVLLLATLSLSLVPRVPGALPDSPAHAQDPCEGIVAAQLEAGGAGRVQASYGVKLKDQPATSAAGGRDLQLLPFGVVVQVTGGYECNYGYRWWPVTVADGTTGWVAEGDSANYFVAPHTIALHTFRIRDEGRQVMRYVVTPDGYAERDITFDVTPVETTIGEAWQPVEIEHLTSALDTLRAECPDRLTSTVWESLDTPDAVEGVTLPPLDYDVYPAPDGDRLLLVRHLTLDVPRCSTVIPETVGISRVSILSTDGTETALFPYPQHGSVPESQDRYTLSAPDRPNVYLDEVAWSPDGQHIAFVAAYLDTCEGEGCYRFHIFVWNTATGQLYVLGEGRHMGWANGGARLNFFRLIADADGNRLPRLYTTRPDGSDRQEIWLPGGAVYVSSEQTPLGFPWNTSGTRVLVGNAGVEEVMLFNLADRDFTPPVTLPDTMPHVNRLDVHLVRRESTLLWTTIRGEFVTQDVTSGEWTPLESEVASLGVAPIAARPFYDGAHALIDMGNGTAYVLDFQADELAQVMVRQ